MSEIKPLTPYRPAAGRDGEVTCLPFDVFYGAEVHEIIAENPNSFLRVTRSENDFSDDANPTREEVLDRAKENLDRLLSDGILIHDTEPAFYVYRLESNGRSQTGVVAGCSLEEYRGGRIKRHEKTQPDKVADRTQHIVHLRAQTGLIFLAFRGTAKIRQLLQKAVLSQPIYDLGCDTGVTHTIWKCTNTDDWIEAFEEVPTIYIADGHHRLESALRARDILRAEDPNEQDGQFDHVMAGLFPAEDLTILAYNRAVEDLNGLTETDLLAKLTESFDVQETTDTTPARHGEIAMYTGGKWYKLTRRNGAAEPSDPVDRLDVSILQNEILAPILGIQDPRTDKRIQFVGGQRGIKELERLVDSGEAAVAFSLFATTMDDLLAVSDADEIMPPKSTWFEPKLRDGFLVNPI